jgi:hypothetical protein
VTNKFGYEDNLGRCHVKILNDINLQFNGKLGEINSNFNGKDKLKILIVRPT